MLYNSDLVDGSPVAALLTHSGLGRELLLQASVAHLALRPAEFPTPVEMGKQMAYALYGNPHLPPVSESETGHKIRMMEQRMFGRSPDQFSHVQHNNFAREAFAADVAARLAKELGSAPTQATGPTAGVN